MAQSIAQNIDGADRAPNRVSGRGGTDRKEKRLERPSRARLTEDGKFSIDKDRVPPGYVMEFKRHNLLGQNDRHNQVIVVQNHWQPVTHKMQPHFYGHTCTNEDEHVIVDGLGLYMRPAYLNEDAAREHYEDTVYQTDQQLQSLRLQSRDQVGAKNTYIKRQKIQPQVID